MRKTSNNRRLDWRAAWPLMLAPFSLSQADDQGVNTRHLSDSSTDRTPAVTAFPKYPSVARRERIEGETVVCFLIDEQGRVVRPSVKSSTHRIFETAAMRAIRSSSFEPLEPGETLDRSRTCRTYRFRLEPVTASNAPASRHSR